MKKLTTKCVDLFCGAGGLTHGLIKEGINVTAGVDLDPTCRYAYEKNNPGIFVERDISKIQPRHLREYFDGADVRILAGCAPCQPFSTYTQGQISSRDGKRGLLYEFSRLTKSIRPEMVTMENVPSVARHAVFEDFVSTLKRLGYDVWHNVVECDKYGVPQSRKRMVLLASKIGPISMVSPTRRSQKTVRQAIAKLAPLEAGGRDAKDCLHVASSLSPKNLRRIKSSQPGGTWRDWPKSLVADCHRSASGKTYPGVYGRMEWDKPAPTITTQCYGFGNGRFGHPEQDRAISLREAAILQGFPRRYKFVAPDQNVEFTNVGRLIGNAVPVQLGQAVARSILDHLAGFSSEELNVKLGKKPRRSRAA